MYSLIFFESAEHDLFSTKMEAIHRIMERGDVPFVLQDPIGVQVLRRFSCPEGHPFLTISGVMGERCHDCKAPAFHRVEREWPSDHCLDCDEAKPRDGERARFYCASHYAPFVNFFLSLA